MWRRELLKNRIYALVLVIIGVLSVTIENDATALVFILMFFAIPLFFAKENYIMEPVRRRKIKREQIQNHSR